MTLLVGWNSREYDVDLSEASVRELDEAQQRTGEDWRTLLVGMLKLDPVAIRVAFWLAERRTNPGLVYSDYDGPPPKILAPHLGELQQIVADLGKLMQAAFAANGLDGSPAPASRPESSTGSAELTSS